MTRQQRNKLNEIRQNQRAVLDSMNTLRWLRGKHEKQTTIYQDYTTAINHMHDIITEYQNEYEGLEQYYNTGTYPLSFKLPNYED